MSKVNKSRKTWTDKGYKKGYGEGHRQGHNKGVAEYKITYPCSICGKELIMIPDNKDHVAMKTMMNTGGWEHASCHEAKKDQVTLACISIFRERSVNSSHMSNCYLCLVERVILQLD